MKYNVVILDEAHERSIYTDILFALVKGAVEKRNGSLKLVVTSATLNTELFSSYFNNCPVLKMEGKCFPVDVKYVHTPSNLRLNEAVKNAIRLHLYEGIGDILVFLTGSEECEQAVRMTNDLLLELINAGREVPSALIYALYGAQSSEDQSRVFEKVDEDVRKIIYSTNIAETSITIDGVGFVIDTGHVKQKQYNPKTGMDCLNVVPISKVQAVQRMGRAGRTMPGKCLRMYSERFFNEQMEHMTVPELLRVNLTSLILTLKCIGIDDVLRFEYMERPDDSQIMEALKQLHLLNAINEDGHVNDFGREMCKLPMEPHFSKCVLISRYLQCQEDIMTVVALLSSERIFASVPRVDEKRHSNYLEVMKGLMLKEGDHATFCHIFKQWVKSGKSDKWAKDHFINMRALRQAVNIKDQIRDLIKSINYSIVEKALQKDHVYSYSKQKGVHFTSTQLFSMALCSSFFFNGARRVHNMAEDYLLLSEGIIVNIDPQSAISVKHSFPEYIIFTELGGTGGGRGTMRTCTAVEGAWITPYATILKNFRSEKFKDMAMVKAVVQERQVAVEKVRAQVQGDDRNSKVAEMRARYQERMQMREKSIGQPEKKLKTN